ncbi:protein terminal ear1 [Striga asiatica]|uniref:Protein terminal ear1 n=1 Tax=Striga asiatica TaxID=4170 RepID=A0A5A7RCA9_STRAF|nr:protein terminal ear1 [Striga asiatica]
MTSFKPQYTPLNPLAPEYTPIPPGITRHPHAPPPPPPPTLFLLPPPQPAFRPPPPPRFPPHLFPTYISPTPHHHTQPYRTTANLPPPPPEGRVPAAQRWRPPPPRRVLWDVGRSRRGGSCGDQNKLVAMHKNGKRSQVFPLRRDEHKTTIMIKNIPYECPRKELINLMDHFCLMENAKAKNKGTSEESSTITAYDFLYLPIDFSTKKSRGFAFVNFTSASAVWRFYQAFHLKNWDFIEQTRWTKKIEVVTAKIQGKEALVNHFSQSIFDCDSDEYLPVTFWPARDGSGQSGQLTAVGLRGYREAHRHHKR